MDLWFWFVLNLHHQTCKILQSLCIFCRISNSQVYSIKQALSSFLTVQPKTVLINNKTIGDNFSYQSQSSPRSAKVLITGTFHNRCQSHCAHKQLVKVSIELLNKFTNIKTTKKTSEHKRKQLQQKKEQRGKSSRKWNDIHKSNNKN